MRSLLGDSWIVTIWCVGSVDFRPLRVGELRSTGDRSEAEAMARDVCSRQPVGGGYHYTIRKSRK